MSNMDAQARKRFLPDEVVLHNETSSAWVIIHESVIDVTPLFQAALATKRRLTKSLRWLLAFSGKDLSQFFDPESRTPLERLTSPSGERVPVFGPCLEHSPVDRRLYWWQDPALVIGHLTARPCRVKIINTLTLHPTEMDVCYEDTVALIREKYLRYNANAAQYEWRKDLAVGCQEGRLQMDKTLAQNGFKIHPDSVSVIWIFYILPPPESLETPPSETADPSAGKCDPPVRV